MSHYLHTLLLLLLLSQCSGANPQDPAPRAATPGEAFLLRIGEQRQVQPTTGEPLSLELTELNDGRCPQDVICVWLGNARAVVQVSEGGARAEKLQFCIGDCRPEPTRNKHMQQVQVDGQRYEITLLQVLPEATSAAAQEPQHVKLLVKPI